jgi:hypothetical protein
MLVKVYSMLSKAIVLFAVCGLIFAGGFFAHADQLDASSHHSVNAPSDHHHSKTDEKGPDISTALHCDSKILILATSFTGIKFRLEPVQYWKTSAQHVGYENVADPPPPRTFPIPT